MGILLGLLTALSWGGSDFVARFTAHRIGAFRTTLYMQLAGFFLLTFSMPFLGGWGHLADGCGWQPWAWGALAGLLNVSSTLALYRSFEVGKLSIVAPISAAYPVVTVVLSFFTGERLSLARLVGIAGILLGVLLVAGGEKTPAADDVETSRGAKRKDNGVAWALCSALGFGVLFWLLGIRVVPRVGSVATVWMIRLTSGALVFAALRLIKQPIRLPRDPKLYLWIPAMGLLDSGAFVLNNFGMQREQVSVVSVLASLYGAVTVFLAAIFLREQVSRGQWAGIAFIFLGIFLISR